MAQTEIEKLLANIEELVPVYMAIPEDYAKSKGVASGCIIGEDGQIYGKVFGNDKLRGRDSFKIAWTKASQVWITGFKTNEYERLVFSDQIDYHTFGISPPDLVGYEGGQPVTLRDGTKLAVGFSGFRGASDLEIVLKAIEKANTVIE
ncbi:MAG: heme-binding protein [Bacteroidota bacterium]|nr:heme-binding protein [Bacteroidota bacterium]